MPDEPDRYQSESLRALLQQVLESDYFTDRVVRIVESVMEKQAVERRCHPKKHACTRCYMPPNPCRPMVSVMMVPIPFFNPFWWADSCLPRPCGPTMPTCCHHGSYPTPPARHPETTGGTRSEYGPPPK